MRVAQRIIEDPERYIGDPKAGADKTPPVEEKENDKAES
jgi:hypothetical protein